MKKLTAYDLLKGYENVIIPPEIDNVMLVPTVDQRNITGESMLFLTDKVNADVCVFDTTELPTTPGAIVASENREVISATCPIIRVKNSREALSYALSNAYGIDYNKIQFIGITGTNGKTTTATLIHRMLSNSGYKTGFIGTGKIISCGNVLSDTTYSMTTPDPTVLYPAIARMQHDGCDYIIMEVSSHAIALGKIAPIQFEYSIFTNLGNDHLDFHGNRDEYFATKLKLFDNTKKGLFNTDDEYSLKAFDLAKCEKATFGVINEADAYASEIDITSLEKTSFFYRQNNLIFKVRSQLCGAFNVYNTLAALRCVIDMGIKPCIAKRALEKIDVVDGRMEIVDGIAKAVIDYAHTPEAFCNCLKTLKRGINAKQKLFVVFGCGGDRDKSKRPLFGKYADMYADSIVITEDNCRSESFSDIAAEIVNGIKNKSYKVIEDRAEAIQYAFRNATPDDLIAVIGKGHEKYKIVGIEYIPFDERKIILDAMRDMEIRYASKS